MTSSIKISASFTATFAIILFFMLAAITDQPAQAQTFTVLHNFNNFPDGKYPKAGLTMDAAGNLYGTASQGGDPNCNNGDGCGTVFRLKRTAHGWFVDVLQIFTGPNGYYPEDRVVFGPDGALYGTTAGGGMLGFGAIFRLTPPPTICHAISCPWTETLLYQFQGGSDGDSPISEVLFDQTGNFYGTVEGGEVYKMTRSGAGWTYSVIHTFNGGGDGSRPFAGLTFDQAGNLYGTTWLGGAQNFGTVYELMPSGGSWQESTLHSFDPYLSPYAGVTFDPAGNLYGGTAAKRLQGRRWHDIRVVTSQWEGGTSPRSTTSAIVPWPTSRWTAPAISMERLAAASLADAVKSTN